MSKKELQKISGNKIQRMSKNAIQTVTAIQTSKTLTQASEKLGISRGALYERIERYNLMPIIHNIKKQAETTLVMASNDVAELMSKQAIEGEKVTKVQLESQKEVLDRAGITKKEPQSQINIASQDMSISFIQV